MMTKEEFCNEANGKPWVNRAEGPSAYDCWGVVIASFKEIEGIELPQIAGYTDKKCKTDKAASEALSTGLFRQSQATDGAIMTVSNNNGLITHVGRCLCGRVLHATAGMGVRWESYYSINSQFKNVRYFKYAAN